MVFWVKLAAPRLARTPHYIRSIARGALRRSDARQKEAVRMSHIPYRMPLAESRVNDIIVAIFSTSILVLAGIITIAQFAYY